MILTEFFVNSELITSKSCITFATDLYSIKLLTFFEVSSVSSSHQDLSNDTTFNQITVPLKQLLSGSCFKYEIFEIFNFLQLFRFLENLFWNRKK